VGTIPLSTNVYGVEFEDINKIQVTSGIYKLANTVLFQLLSTYKDGQGSFLRSYIASSILYESDNLLLDTLLSSEINRVESVIKNSQRAIVELEDLEKAAVGQMEYLQVRYKDSLVIIPDLDAVEAKILTLL